MARIAVAVRPARDRRRALRSGCVSGQYTKSADVMPRVHQRGNERAPSVVNKYVFVLISLMSDVTENIGGNSAWERRVSGKQAGVDQTGQKPQVVARTGRKTESVQRANSSQHDIIRNSRQLRDCAICTLVLTAMSLETLPVEVILDNLLMVMPIQSLVRLGCTNKVKEIIVIIHVALI